MSEYDTEVGGVLCSHETHPPLAELDDRVRREWRHGWATWWRHHKGGCYEAVRPAVLEQTGEVVVVYRRFCSGVWFVRPLREWEETVRTADGRDVPRFRRLEPGEAPE